MHRSPAVQRAPGALVAAAAASLALAACSQATTANSSHTETAVSVIAPTPSGHQTQTLRYETDIDAATVQLDVPPGAAWHRVSQVYGALKIPVTVLDSARGIVGARGARVRDRMANERLSTWFSCGITSMGSPRADSYTLFVTALTQIQPAATGSTARTIVSATAEANDSPSGAVQCSSTGALEDRLGHAFTAQ